MVYITIIGKFLDGKSLQPLSGILISIKSCIIWLFFCSFCLYYKPLSIFKSIGRFSFNKPFTRATNSAFLRPFLCPLNSNQRFNSSTLHSARSFVSLAPSASFSVRIISGRREDPLRFQPFFSNEVHGLSANPNLTNYTHKLRRSKRSAICSYFPY